MNSQQSLQKSKSDKQSQLFVAKILMIGDSSVGKTAILRQYIEGIFENYNMPTIGIDSRTKVINVDGIDVKLQLWDTAGQEKYKVIGKRFFHQAEAAIIVFDLTNETTFENVKNWLRELKLHAPQDVLKILLGNKMDLKQEIVVSDEDIKQLTDKYQLAFWKTSAKEKMNIDESFMHLAREIAKKNNLKPKENPDKKQAGFSLKDNNKTKENTKNSKCCK